jgi:hypothetical protein
MQIECGVPVTDNAAGECRVLPIDGIDKDDKTFFHHDKTF